MVWPRVCTWPSGPLATPHSVLPSLAGLAGLTQKDGLFIFFIPSSSKGAQLFPDTRPLLCIIASVP